MIPGFFCICSAQPLKTSKFHVKILGLSHKIKELLQLCRSLFLVNRKKRQLHCGICFAIINRV
ncbi:MAG TPA: hypothetical protein ENK14_00270 [Caldithrix sp.]|nr:hypothetical protein [Caldithrix sp.]